MLLALVLNHLAEEGNLPFSEAYEFPLVSTLVSIGLSIVILFIANLNFEHYKKTKFSSKINSKVLIRFLMTTLTYVSLFYIPLFLIVTLFQDGEFEFYSLIIGLGVTVLLTSLMVIFVFAEEIYKLHKMEAISGKLDYKKSGKTFLINLSDIFYIYSENKIVKIMKADGQPLITDFTLNEVEAKLNEHLFFKANRQTIIHARAIDHVESIENGKLLVSLNPGILNKENHRVNISRYKKKAFQEWFERKL